MADRGYKECPWCAEPIRERARICRFCGRDVTAAAEDETDAPSSSRAGSAPSTQPVSLAAKDRIRIEGGVGARPWATSVVSPLHLRRLEAFLEHHEDEYRAATILFADIRGYTSICEKLRAEQVKEILDAYYAICLRAVDAFNGFVLKFQGDACMAVFGAPVAFDRDAECALRAALEIRTRVDALPEFHGHRIKITAGLETGQVLSTLVAAEPRAIFEVFGSAVNLAARIQSAAGTNEVLVGPGTYEVTCAAFHFKAHKPRRFKNVEAMVSTYAVESPRKNAGRSHDSERLPFAGRSQELARLEKLWAKFASLETESQHRGESEARQSGRAKKNCPSGILVTGEPGIGKTRLILEFLATHRKDARIVRVETAPYRSRVAWGVLSSVIRALAGPDAADRREVVGEAEEYDDDGEIDTVRSARADISRLADSLGIDADIRRTLSVIAGDPDAGAELEARLGSVGRQLVSHDIGGVLERFGRRRRLVVFIDDIQWADAGSLEAIAGMCDTLSMDHVLFVLACRSGAEQALPAKFTGFERLHVFDLDEKSRTRLFRSLADTYGLLPDVRDELLLRGEGNPFFLSELARVVAERQQGSGTFKRSKRPAAGTTSAGGRRRNRAETSIPATLLELLQARIDLLDTRRKQVLQCASVLGRRFSFQILDLFRFVRSGLLARLYSLTTLELLEQNAGELPDLQFLFRHSLTREVAYSSLLDTRRRELHKVAAEAIERAYPARLDELAPLLAHHFAGAGMNEKAILHLLAAGETAARKSAAPEALMCFEEAIAMADAAKRSPQMNRLHSDALQRRGRVLSRIGRGEEALRCFEAAEQLLSAEKDTLQLARLQADSSFVLVQRGEYEAVEDVLQKILPRARGADDPKLVAQVLLGLGVAAWGRGNLGDARRYYEEAGEMDEAQVGFSCIADARNNLGLIAWKEGKLGQAATWFRSATRVRKQAGDRFGIAATIMNSGIIDEALGRTEQAGKRYRQCRELAQRHGFAQLDGAACANLANIALQQGEAAVGLDFSARALDIAERIGDRRSEAIALENLAQAHLGLGQWDMCKTRTDQGMKVARQLGDADRLLSLELVRAESFVAQDQPDKAHRVLKKATNMLGSGGFESERPRLLRLSVHAHIAAGDRGKIEELAALALEECVRQQNKVEEQKVRALLSNATGSR